MKMRIQSVFVWSAAIAMFAGCADQDYPDIDYSGTHQNASSKLDAGQCINTPNHTDCNEPANDGDTQHIYSAPFTGNRAPQIEKDYEGYYGVIDDACHEWHINDGVHYFSGDMDYIELNADPGTPLTVKVSRVPGHKTNPMLTLRNSDGIDLLFGGSPASGISQISFFMPGNTAYIAVEESSNYDAGGITNCRDFDFKGGKKYHYLLTVNNADFNMMNARTIVKNGESNELVGGSIPVQGSVQYYSILVEPSIRSFSIELTPTISSQDDMPVITPLERTDDETIGYNWVIPGSTKLKEAWTSETSKVSQFSIPSQEIDIDRFLQLYATPKEDMLEIIFAVSDLNGHYGYPYSIKVSAE